MVTVPLQPFLLYLNLALKNTYWTGIWLSKILTGKEFGSHISLPKLNTFDLREASKLKNVTKCTSLAPKILTGKEFGSQISLNIVDEVIEVDKLDEGNMWKMTFGGRQPSVEDNLWWKTTFG